MMAHVSEPCGMFFSFQMQPFHYSNFRAKFEGEEGSGPGVNRGFFAAVANALKADDKVYSPLLHTHKTITIIPVIYAFDFYSFHPRLLPFYTNLVSCPNKAVFTRPNHLHTEKRQETTSNLRYVG
jgi:hypothetical protein